jgi:hypothetical protein
MFRLGHNYRQEFAAINAFIDPFAFAKESIG